MKIVKRIREYRRSNSVHTFPDRMAMLLNSISMRKPVRKIGHLAIDMLNETLSSNPVIVEVGSFNGKDTYRLASSFPNASVFGFEPVPELYSVAVRRCLNKGNVKILQLAVSDSTGWKSLSISGGTSRASSSILDPGPIGKYFRGIKFEADDKICVASVTLADWISNSSLEKIDLLWIDVQGAEGLVLHGLEEKLDIVDMIYSEVNFEESYSGSVLFDEIESYLVTRGFTLRNVWRDGPSGDALFQRMKTA